MHIPPRTTNSPYGDLLTRMRCIGRIEIRLFVRYRPGDPQQFVRRCTQRDLAWLARHTQPLKKAAITGLCCTALMSLFALY